MQNLLNRFNSQYKVAEYLGVAQMTIQRHAKRLGIKYDGRKFVDLEVSKIRGQKLKAKYESGELIPAMDKMPPNVRDEHIRKMNAARVDKIKGKPSWNSGKGKCSTKCYTCESWFDNKIKKGRPFGVFKVFCSKTCQSKYVSKTYSDGRYLGDRNPNYGNDALKQSWARGDYDERPLPKHGRGKGGYYKGKWMRSSWEIEFAQNLDSNNINYDYEPKRFKLSNGTSYTPDFYIPSVNLWIEIKGFWTESAKKKFSLFVEEYKNEKIIVIGEKPLWHHLLNG
jgi:hypothetical protein